MTKIGINESFLIKTAIAAYTRHFFLFTHSLSHVFVWSHKVFIVLQTNYLCIAIAIWVHVMLSLF